MTADISEKLKLMRVWIDEFERDLLAINQPLPMVGTWQRPMCTEARAAAVFIFENPGHSSKQVAMAIGCDYDKFRGEPTKDLKRYGFNLDRGRGWFGPNYQELQTPHKVSTATVQKNQPRIA